ncbi:MAG: hypothetical protein WKF31_11515 [Thermoleophilaceae bacterium]
MLVVVGVALAFFGARSASGATGLEQRAGDGRVVFVLAREHSEGGRADVGAVEVEAYALAQLLDALL